jgi:hypothetical protein
MQRTENAKPCRSHGIQGLQHIRNAVVRFGNALDTIPYLATLGNEVVIRIDHQKCSDLLVIRVSRHDVSSVVKLESTI